MGKGSIMKQQLNVRVSKATRAKLDFLTDRLYGTQTEAIAVAVDRLYQARIVIEQSLPIWQHLLLKGKEVIQVSDEYTVGPCEICGEKIDPDSQWCEGDTGDICAQCWADAEE
jgi:hypothetical protein